MTQISTTHVGSLPRGSALTPLLLARDKGEPYDAAEFDAVVQAAVDEAVRQQVAAGVSVVSDGELGKVGYSTYIIERLTGFGGHSPRKPALDLAPLPEFRQKMTALMGEQEFTRASCIGEVRIKDMQPLEDDIRRFTLAMQRNGAGVRGFMNAASPGLITAFQPNAFYPSHEAYLADLVAAMRPEYEAIVAAGFDLQLDCPDLAMSRHTGYQDLDEPAFLRRIEQNVEALNAATANIDPKRLRMHICWGNYEGPHNHDIPLEKIIGTLREGKWPLATTGNTYAELIVSHQGHEHTVTALDYPGEVFRKAFMGDSEDADANELRAAIDRAAAMIVLIDPAVVASGGAAWR